MLSILSFTFFFNALYFEGFSDVPKGHWAYEATTTLKEAGLLKGYPDGKFRG